MSDNYSKPRQQAELAFGKTQSQFFARERVLEERDLILAAWNGKTARLREARLARDKKDSIALPDSAT